MKRKFFLAAMYVLTIGLAGASNYFPPFHVAILPNEPQDKGRIKKETIRSINRHFVALNIFTGDSKSGKEKCTDEIIGKNMIDYFHELNAPTIYSLGDNEWTDCHRISNGSYDPLERLDFLRKTFFSKNMTQGKSPIAVERQGNPGKAYSENSRLILNNIMFVALHVVGSNNNLVSSKKLCTKASERTEDDCLRATDEYRERTRKNIEWLKSSFQIAREKGLAGIAVIIQANPFYHFHSTYKSWKKDFLPRLNEENGFTNFITTLIEETHSFKGKVALIHGDSHFFIIDKAMYNKNGGITPNFTRVETFGSIEQSWIDMYVDPNGKTVFSFKPIILNNLKEQ